MLGIDTNVLVRFLVRDDEGQFERARRLIKREVGSEEDVFVSLLVLVETEWVLRRVYGYSRPEIIRELRRFVGLPRISLEEPELASTALDWGERGLDFADALHLAKAAGCEAFLSFDQRLRRRAKGSDAVEVRPP